MALGHWADKLSIATKQFILDRELEEMTGRGRDVRQPEKKVEPATKSRGRVRAVRDRWRMSIDLRWPSPLATARPKSAEGATSFHMRVETVSRSANGASGGGGASSSAGDGAGRFDVYVTDGLTPAQVDAGRFDRYASDVEGVLAPSDPEVETGTRVAFLITNIDADPEKREAFWQARHAAARKRGDHVVELVPALGSIEDWQMFQRDKDLPFRVREGVTKILTALEAASRRGRPARTVKVRRIRIESAAELAWAVGLGDRFGVKRKKRMLHYVRPRGGQVQRRFDVEIPAGLTHYEVLRVAREKAVLFERMKLPFLIAVHRPDADNDPRNWHLHLLYFPQPGERGADGAWRFGKPSDGVGMLRPGDIAVQLQGADALGGHTHYERRAKADLRALREAYADICNQVLADAGDIRRLDPRRYKAMGIAKKPEWHLGSAEAHLNFAGVDTATTRANATKHWEWVVTQRLAQVDRFRARSMASLDATREAADVDGALKRERDRLAAHLDALVRDRREFMLLDARLDIARSSAKRVRDNIETTLERIAVGEADSSDVGREDAIRRRLHLAEHHLVEITDAVEPWRHEMESCRRDLERRERDLHDGVQAFVARVSQAEPEWQKVIRKIGQSMNVRIVAFGADRRAQVIGLSSEDQAVLDDPYVRRAAQARLMRIADRQILVMKRVLESVRSKGLDATENAVRADGRPRAEANLLRRYRSHPWLVARLDRADAEWSERAIRTMEDISRDVASRATAAVQRSPIDVAAMPDRIVDISPSDPPGGVIREGMPGVGPVVKPEAPMATPERAAPDLRRARDRDDPRTTGKGADSGADAHRGPMRTEADAPTNEQSSSGGRNEDALSDGTPLIQSIEGNTAGPLPGTARQSEEPDVEEAGALASPEAPTGALRDAVPVILPDASTHDEPTSQPSSLEQADVLPNATGPAEKAPPVPPVTIHTDGEVAEPVPSATRRDEQVVSPSQPVVNSAIPDVIENPSLAEPEAAEPQTPPRKRLMDIAREAAAGRKDNSTTKDPPETPKASSRPVDPVKPRSPSVQRPLDRSPASSDQDWLEQQKAWQDRKGPGRR